MPHSIGALVYEIGSCTARGSTGSATPRLNICRSWSDSLLALNFLLRIGGGEILLEAIKVRFEPRLGQDPRSPLILQMTLMHIPFTYTLKLFYSYIALT
jgi:hypothetical protein